MVQVRFLIFLYITNYKLGFQPFAVFGTGSGLFSKPDQPPISFGFGATKPVPVEPVKPLAPKPSDEPSAKKPFSFGLGLDQKSWFWFSGVQFVETYAGIL